MKKIIVLILIVIAAIGLFNDIESMTSKGSSSGHKSSGSSNSYSYSGGSYSTGGSSYSYTCYKCLNKGQHTCSDCNGKGYKTEYISVPNYSGTGSSPSKVIKKDCTNCVDGIQDCRHCYN